jgi:hypothetical protein
MAKTPEAVVKEAVKKFLREHNVWFYMPVSHGLGRVGIPDFVCCYEGKFFTVETKAPGKVNNTTPNQEQVMKEIRDHGGKTVVVDNVIDLEKFFRKDMLT